MPAFKSHLLSTQWNQPWWGYLHYWNWQKLQIRTGFFPPPREPVVKYLAAYHFFDLTIFTNYHPIFFFLLSFLPKYIKSHAYFLHFFFAWTHYSQAFVPTSLLKLLLSRSPMATTLLNLVVNVQSSYNFIYYQHLTQLTTFLSPHQAFLLSLLLVHAPSSNLLMLEYSRAQSLALFFSPSTLIPLMV